MGTEPIQHLATATSYRLMETILPIPIHFNYTHWSDVAIAIVQWKRAIRIPLVYAQPQTPNSNTNTSFKTHFFSNVARKILIWIRLESTLSLKSVECLNSRKIQTFDNRRGLLFMVNRECTDRWAYEIMPKHTQFIKMHWHVDRTWWVKVKSATHSIYFFSLCRVIFRYLSWERCKWIAE